MTRMLFMVSNKLSPFITELSDEEKFIISAESLFSASSKDNFVLVLFSKKIFAIVKCLNDGTFLMGLDRTSLNILAVSKINSISSIDKSFIPSKCLDFSLFIIGYPYIIFFKTLFGKVNYNFLRC